MKFDNATVLVTGAACALGLAFARKAFALGAREVRAVARVPARLKEGDKLARNTRSARAADPAVFLDVLRLDA